MKGITAYGVYLPYYRLKRENIFKAMGWFNPATAGMAKGEKAVSHYDEDTITMSAAAGIECLTDCNRDGIDALYLASTYRCSAKAYEEAGIENPREELSMMEVHDCFSITELVTYENLQFSPRGRAREDVDAGFYDLDGKIPCQSDGGLKSFGHPIGASRIRMIYEVYNQLREKCEERQIKNPHLGMTHNLGGFPANCVIAISIWGNEL